MIIALLLALACGVYGVLMVVLVERSLTSAESQRGNLEHCSRRLGESGTNPRLIVDSATLSLGGHCDA